MSRFWWSEKANIVNDSFSIKTKWKWKLMCATCIVSPATRSMVLFLHFINTFYVCFILESSLLYLIKAFCFKDCNEFLIMSLPHVFYEGNLSMCFSWMWCGWWFSGDTQAVRNNKLFPPQSFSSGHSKKPPHWDYLVICSPNFYEVAFPFDFCSFVLCFLCFTL